MPGLNKEAMESLNQIMIMIKGETAAEKVKKIFMFLGINVHPNEIARDEKTLKQIIEGRMLRTCPKCKGNFTFGRPCGLCEDHGEVNGITEEKFFLSQTQMA